MLLKIEYALIVVLIIIALRIKSTQTFKLAITSSVILFIAGALMLVIAQEHPIPDMTTVWVGLGLYGIAFLLSVIAFFNRKRSQD